MRMYTEGEAASKQPRLGQYITNLPKCKPHLSDTMNGQGRENTPPGDRVSSAADAMLKLSTSLPTQSAPQSDYSVPATHSDEYKDQGDYDSEDSLKRHKTRGDGSVYTRQSRKQRQFIPEFKKDEQYWTKRRKNNEAAKRSREKRRMNDLQMGQQIHELNKVNESLQRELRALKKKFGLPLDEVFVDEDEMDSTPASLHQHIPSSTGMGSNSPSNIADTPQNNPRAVPGMVAASVVAQQLKPSLQAMAVGQALEYRQQQHTYPSPVTSVSSAIPVLMPSPHTSTAMPQGQNSGSKAQYPPPLMPLTEAAALFGKASNNDAAAASIARVQVPQDQRPPTSYQKPTGHSPAHSNQDESLDCYQNMKAPLTHPISPGSGSSSSPPCLKINLSEVSDSLNDESSGEELAERRYQQFHVDEDCPLNLSKKEVDPQIQPDARYPCHALNGSPEHTANGASPEKRRHVRKGMPLKLWHKTVTNYNDEREMMEECQQEPSEARMPYNFENPAEVKSEYELMHFSAKSSEKLLNKFNPSYVERRYRNNMAARKCRENRKVANEIRLVQSNVLENENAKLKEELQSLSHEITDLKELLEKKKQAQAKGEQFEPPPLEQVKQQADNGQDSC